MYLGRAGPYHLDSCGTPQVGNAHLLQQITFQSIDQGLSRRSVGVGIQGSQTNLDKANLDTCNSIKCISAAITTRQPLK